ncbi:NADH-ubiquinone oxidoreductase-F iron-sulfur binding region domain-containing protein [Pseudonocardia sp. GCM10023141]|uniref:NADH-ubiquinone oxidoreductase-F iron-sulfur binding region domain-containing protein n=1 Tax=Pseudonocardia sp. GCM10023141 TaxID=3252653 RepID=UPI00360ED188
MTTADTARGVDRPSPPGTELRLLAGWADTGSSAGARAHLARYGPVPLTAFRGAAGADRLIETVAAAGLRGRGGGGFATARKLVAVATGRGRRTVVANGCEGDPSSTKDQVLLELAPHLVLDGIVLAAHAVGATDAVLCVHGGAGAQRLSAAVRERDGDPVGITVVPVPGHYVASEESALVNFLNTGDARPTVTPPRPAQRGVRGGPTLVDNVETLAHLALIARFGAGWFRTAGTAASPGTTLITLGGAVTDPGVYEIALGTTIGQVLARAAGPSDPLQAVLIGGLSGSWLPADDAADLPLTHEDCRAAGASFGVAVVGALPERACGIVESARILRRLAEASARQCGPCMFGLPAVADDMARLAVAATPQTGLLDRLHRRLAVIPGRGACAHPDGSVRMTASALDVFAADAAEHAAGRPCRWAGPAAAPRSSAVPPQRRRW